MQWRNRLINSIISANIENGLAPSWNTFNKFFSVTCGKTTQNISNCPWKLLQIVNRLSRKLALHNGPNIFDRVCVERLGGPIHGDNVIFLLSGAADALSHCFLQDPIFVIGSEHLQKDTFFNFGTDRDDFWTTAQWLCRVRWTSLSFSRVQEDHQRFSTVRTAPPTLQRTPLTF